MDPLLTFLVTGPASFVFADGYFGNISGPGAFGTGLPSVANDGSGDVVGFQRPFLVVPHGYISGNPLSDSSTYANQTFSSLGVEPGFHKWSWGTGPDQSFTLLIEAPTMPDDGSSLALLSMVLLCLLGLVQKRMVRI